MKAGGRNGFPVAPRFSVSADPEAAATSPVVGVVTSGFTFLKVGAYYQEIVKGMIIVAAVIVDVHRQRKKSRA